MRVFISLVFFALLVPFSAFAAIPQKPAFNSYVYDYENVISDDVEQQLIQAAKAKCHCHDDD